MAGGEQGGEKKLREIPGIEAIFISGPYQPG